MHMVFHVQSGTVEVRVHENEFTIHKHGIWQVPRGTLLSVFSAVVRLLSSLFLLNPALLFSFSLFFLFPFSRPFRAWLYDRRQFTLDAQPACCIYSPMGVMQRHTASERQEHNKSRTGRGRGHAKRVNGC